jgi:hypothetical protein
MKYVYIYTFSYTVYHGIIKYLSGAAVWRNIYNVSVYDQPTSSGATMFRIKIDFM